MTLKLQGSTSGHTAIEAPASAGSNTLVLPPNNGTAGQYLKTDGNGNLSWVDPPDNKPIVMAYRSASDSIPLTSDVFTDATWLSTDLIDTDNAWNTSTATFTVPSGKGGKYVIAAGANAYSNSNNMREFRPRIVKNGANDTYIAQYAHIPTNDGHRHVQGNIHAIVPLNAGDWLRFQVLVKVASGLVYISNDGNGKMSNYFSAYRLLE